MAKSLVTMKEGLQIAQQFAPHVKRIDKDIRHGIPAAQHMSPQVAAARVQKSGAGQLFDSLAGFGAQAIKTNDTHAKYMQGKVADEMTRRKMSPELYGDITDKSNLPYQWNPVFMKLYDKALGEKFANDNFTSSFEEVMNSEGVYALSEEQFTEKVIEGVKKRAGESGLDPDSGTQMMAFSNSLNPAVQKGTAEFIAKKSAVLGKAAQQDRIAGVVSRLKGADLSTPEGAAMVTGYLRDETITQLGSAKGREVFMKVAKIFAENGDEAQLEALRGLKFGDKTLEELQLGGWDLLSLQASNTRHALGRADANNWEIEKDRLLDGDDFNAYRAHLNGAPAAMKTREPEFLRQWNDHQKAKNLKAFNESVRVNTDAATTDLGMKLWTSYKGGGSPDIVSDHPVQNLYKADGTQVVISAKDAVGAATRMAQQEIESVRQNTELTSKQRAEEISKLLQQAGRMPDGGAEVYRTTMKATVDSVAMVMNDATELERMASGKVSDSFVLGLDILEAVHSRKPDAVTDNAMKLAGNIFNVRDALGASSVEAAQIYARSKHSPVEVKKKATDKVKSTLSGSDLKHLSADQQAAVRNSMDTLLKAGMTVEDIEFRITSNLFNQYHAELDMGDAVGRIPRKAITIDQGYEANFTQWNNEYLGEMATAAMKNNAYEGSPSMVKFEYTSKGVNLMVMGGVIGSASYDQLQANFNARRDAHINSITTEANRKVKVNADAKKRREGTLLGEFDKAEARNKKSSADAEKRTREIVEKAQKRNGTVTPEFSVPTLKEGKRRKPVSR